MIEHNIKTALKSLENNINVVAATKMQSVQTLEIAKSCGIKIFGENKVQELLEKYQFFPDMEWHFIGHLQTNKVKLIVDKVQLIHSVDSLKLAKEINKEAAKISKVQNILLQINVAKEDTKSGFDFAEIDSVIAEIGMLENINILGLMAMVPLACNIEENKIYYLQMAEKYSQIKDRYGFKYLSMGMSNDYHMAVECGSNTVRIGSALFGARQYN